MTTAGRNLLVVLSTFVAALLVAALGQGAFSHLFPAVSGRIVGRTDVATYALLVLIAASFFVVGFAVPRWIRSRWPLAWLLLPVVSVYVIAILGQPYVYRCNPLSTTYVASCWMTLSPFIVGSLAVVAGYLFRRRKAGSFAHAV